MTYPLPSHAAHIWAEGDNLVLCFPPSDGATKSHIVKFNTQNLHLMHQVLKDRVRATNARKLRIAEEGCITQAQLREMAGYLKAETTILATKAQQAKHQAEKALVKSNPSELLKILGLVKKEPTP